MARISLETVAKMRQLWRDGYSAPEIAKMCSSTSSTVKKKLGRDIEAFITEHNEAKRRREQKSRVDEIIPQQPNFNVVLTDELIKDDSTITPQVLEAENELIIETEMAADREVAKELDMTNEQFISLLDYEFSQATNYEQAKELYWEYKPQSVINIVRVKAFRAIYERTLDRINKTVAKPDTKSEKTIIKIEPEKVIENLEKEKTDDSFVGVQSIPTYRLAWTQEIESLNNKYNAGIIKPRRSSLINWSQCRYEEHLYFWLRKTLNNPKDFPGVSKFLKDYPAPEAKREVINKVIEQLNAEK